jgi:hypothetical protein
VLVVASIAKIKIMTIPKTVKLQIFGLGTELAVGTFLNILIPFEIY